MDAISPLLLAGLIAATALMTLGVLYILALRVRNECELHDLTVSAHALRQEQARRLELLGHSGGDTDSSVWDVDIVRDAA